MEKFTGRPEDDRVVKRHAVHEGDSIYTRKDSLLKSSREAAPNNNAFKADNPDSAYRLTGKPQIDDMVRSGQVRPKEGKIKGGSRDAVFWTKGNKNLSYSGGYVIETDAKVGDLKRPLSLDEVKVKTQTKPGVWEDVTDEIKKASKAFRSKLTNPKTAALRRAAAGDAAAAGPASAKQFLDDSVAYGRMGTVGAGLSDATRTGPVRPTAY